MYSCPCQIGECVLCEAHMFVGLSSAQLCEIRGLLTKHSYRPRQVLFREGEPSTHLYALRSGQAKLTTSLPDGREQILRLGVAGHLLGFEAVDDEVYPYSAEAMTNVEACGIQHKDMLRILEENPTVSLRVVHMLNEELEEAMRLIRDLGLKNAIEKVASFILSLVPIRGPAPQELPVSLSRLEIAEMLGLTEETVSRVMTELRRDALINAPRGSIEILDYARLEALAGGLAPPDPVKTTAAG